MTAANLTLDQFLAMAETEPASEYVCGQVQQKPMPNFQHSGLQTLLSARLMLFAMEHQLGFAGSELRCVFGPAGQERALVPDICFVSDARMPAGDTLEPDSFYGAPDLAVEVLSPDQPMAAFADKIQFYLANGVRLVWVLDPKARSVTVHVPGGPPRTLTSGATLDGGEVLPGFAMTAVEVFAPLRR